MKFLFDFFPVILFFITFKWGNTNPEAAQEYVRQYLSFAEGTSAQDATHAPILLATAVAILATVAQIGYLLARRRKVDVMLWVSFAIIVFFGGATIYFNNETFIKWKPTVLYWCVAVALLISQLFFKKNLIRASMEKQVSLPDAVWQRLNLAWVGFMAIMGFINLYVAFNFPTSTWVNFKLFGSMGLMIVFVLGQGLFLSKYLKDIK